MYRLNARGALWQDGDPNRIPLEMLKLVIGNKNYSSWSMRPWLALRSECGMNLHRPIRAVALSDDARGNVARIQAIWAECHQRYGNEGPFLFGVFSGADAMFAPVVHRFRSYAIPVAGDARHFVDAMTSLPAFDEWTRDGLAETLRIDRLDEI